MRYYSTEIARTKMWSGLLHCIAIWAMLTAQEHGMFADPQRIPRSHADLVEVASIPGGRGDWGRSFDVVKVNQF